MDANSKDAFVPPKPKEFDKAALIGISFEAVKGMKPSLKMGSGLVRLRVKGAIPCNKTTEQLVGQQPNFLEFHMVNSGQVGIQNCYKSSIITRV